VRPLSPPLDTRLHVAASLPYFPPPWAAARFLSQNPSAVLGSSFTPTSRDLSRHPQRSGGPAWCRWSRFAPVGRGGRRGFASRWARPWTNALGSRGAAGGRPPVDGTPRTWGPLSDRPGAAARWRWGWQLYEATSRYLTGCSAPAMGACSPLRTTPATVGRGEWSANNAEHGSAMKPVMTRRCDGRSSKTGHQRRTSEAQDSRWCDA